MRRRKTSVKIRRRNDGAWEFVHPACAQERAEDIEQVQHMLEMGETEVATDELRWLLSECRDFIIAHRILGEIALTENDLRLARAHFGYAFEIGWSAMPASGVPGPFPYKIAANQPFLEACKGLAHCLRELNKARFAEPVIRVLLQCDPTDPLGVREWLKES